MAHPPLTPGGRDHRLKLQSDTRIRQLPDHWFAVESGPQAVRLGVEHELARFIQQPASSEFVFKRAVRNHGATQRTIERRHVVWEEETHARIDERIQNALELRVFRVRAVGKAPYPFAPLRRIRLEVLFSLRSEERRVGEEC